MLGKDFDVRFEHRVVERMVVDYSTPHELAVWCQRAGSVHQSSACLAKAVGHGVVRRDRLRLGVHSEVVFAADELDVRVKGSKVGSMSASRYFGVK